MTPIPGASSSHLFLVSHYLLSPFYVSAAIKKYYLSSLRPKFEQIAHQRFSESSALYLCDISEKDLIRRHY
jgi:hypothetical protein